MTLLRVLASLSLKFNFTFDVKGISTSNNKLADNLSRFISEPMISWPFAAPDSDPCLWAVKWLIDTCNQEFLLHKKGLSPS